MRSLFTLLALSALLVGCKKEPPPDVLADPDADAPRGTHVFLQTDLELPSGTQATQERVAMRGVLEDAQYAARVCYAQAIQRNPYTYGDLRVKISLDASGAVTEADPIFSSLQDPLMEACVLAIVRNADFPPPSKPSLVLSYPFIFTSDLTPSEISRALLMQCGLLDLDAEESRRDPSRGDPVQGQEGWWETW